MAEPTRTEKIAQAKSKLWSELGKMVSGLVVGPLLIYVAWSRPHYMERLANKLTVVLFILGGAFVLAFFMSAWESLKLGAELVRLKYVEKDPPAPTPALKEDIDVSFDEPQQ